MFYLEHNVPALILLIQFSLSCFHFYLIYLIWGRCLPFPQSLSHISSHLWLTFSQIMLFTSALLILICISTFSFFKAFFATLSTFFFYSPSLLCALGPIKCNLSSLVCYSCNWIENEILCVSRQLATRGAENTIWYTAVGGVTQTDIRTHIFKGE